MRTLVALGLLLAGCPAPSSEPAWAVDPIWLEPGDTPDEVFGFQTWELFAAGWERNYHGRYYLCAVMVRIDGVPTDPCADCEDAWEIQTRLVETDCTLMDEELDRFGTLERVGLGTVPDSMATDAPYPGQTSAVYADYGNGWESYGLGWPAALDEGAAVGGDGSWDGAAPFTLRPSLLWDLGE